MVDKAKINVLLVDDDEHIRKLMKVALKEMNCNIILEAKNGKEAVELFKQHKPHITIMDIIMPVMDGKEALRRIKIESPEAFIIMLTSVTSTDEVSDIIDLGVSNYIRKDVPLKEIKHSIKDAWIDYLKTLKKQNG